MSLVKCLVEHGANVNETIKSCTFYSDFHYNDYSYYEVVEFPLSIACEKQNESLVKYLVEHGANVNTFHPLVNVKKELVKFKTPLSIVYEKKKNKTLINYLEDHGANISTVTEKKT